jgi:hypothetical protein
MVMIELWLRTGALGIIVIPVVLLYPIAAGIVWLTHLSPARPLFASCVGVVGPFFASVGVLFALLAAFLANDVQHRNAQARAAVLSEADGVRTILRLAEALGEVGGPVKAAALDYAQRVLDQEWPAMRGGGNVIEDLGAVRNLSLAVMAQPLIAAAPPTAHQAIVNGLVQIRQARLERISLTSGISDPVNWLGMLILGIWTQVAVAVVHLDRLRPQALALFVFSTAFAVTVVLIGLGERPSSGRQIDDAPLRAAIASAAP